MIAILCVCADTLGRGSHHAFCKDANGDFAIIVQFKEACCAALADMTHGRPLVGHICQCWVDGGWISESLIPCTNSKMTSAHIRPLSWTSFFTAAIDNHRTCSKTGETNVFG
eukprot:886516-Amphidinium_carterae.1